MWKTFRSRILVVMFVSTVVVMGVFMFLAQHEMQTAMIASSAEASQNSLRLAMLTIENQWKSLQVFKQALLASHQRELRNLVSIQVKYVQEFYEKSQRGELTVEQAKRLALEGLRAFRYGDNDYFWVSNYQSVLISHPDAKLHGADFSAVKDVKGNLIVSPMVADAQKQDEGFYSYWWRRLSAEDPVEKLTFYKHFPAWQWVLGTGVYIDDIEQEAQRCIEAMLENLRRTFTTVKVAKSGYLFLFDQNKQVLIHPSLKSEELAQLQNPTTGKLIVDELIAASAHPDTPFEYLWDHPDTPGAFRFWKQSYVAYFEPMGWYLASSVYKTEILAPIQRLQHKFLLLAVAILIFAAALAIFFTKFLTRPIKKMMARLELLANFDFTIRFDDNLGVQELNTLAAYFNLMLSSFLQVIGQVQHLGIQVTSSSTELAATAKQQEVTMKTQMESVRHVVTSVQEISNVVAHLVDTMHEVAALSEKTGGLAQNSQHDLGRMEETMQRMEHASQTISGRLQVIHEKADNITTVVTTITKVADQTNLLSLNAAIEAEKAGEYGRGFTVVAREIRRLADQTAVATLDIEQMVKEMQSAVSAGVMEMDKFVSEVKHSAADVEKISTQLSKIIEQVQALTPSFEQVNGAMGQQSVHAQEIQHAMLNLSDEMQQTTEALRETFQAIGQLNDIARELQNEISRFKVN